MSTARRAGFSPLALAINGHMTRTARVLTSPLDTLTSRGRNLSGGLVALMLAS